jgi:hypothetical protein
VFPNCTTRPTTKFQRPASRSDLPYVPGPAENSVWNA